MKFNNKIKKIEKNIENFWKISVSFTFVALYSFVKQHEYLSLTGLKVNLSTNFFLSCYNDPLPAVFWHIYLCKENFCWPIGFYFLPTKPFIFYANFRFLSHYQCKITIVCLLFFENGRKRDLILLCITLIYNLLCVWARRKTKAIHYFSVPNKTHMSTKHTKKILCNSQKSILANGQIQTS